jgi:hypothetical protein
MGKSKKARPAKECGAGAAITTALIVGGLSAMEVAGVMRQFGQDGLARSA